MGRLSVANTAAVSTDGDDDTAAVHLLTDGDRRGRQECKR